MIGRNIIASGIEIRQIKILRLQGILRAVFNVILMTLSIHSRGQVFSCSHFHVGTKTQKNSVHCKWSNFSNLTFGNRMQRHARVIKRFFGSNIFPHRRTGIQKRETHLMCPNPCKHSNSHRQQPQLNLTRNWAPGLLCHWEQSTLEGLPLAGVSALERYTTPPHEETEFLRMTEQFPLPCPCLWILFPLRNQIQKITPSSQALIFIGSVF